MGFLDRLLTIAATATLTSAAWIVAGSSFTGSPQESAGPPERQNDSTSTSSPRAAAAITVAAADVSTSDAQESARLLIPVAGIVAAQLSDTFDDVRGGGARRHEALDIMAPEGTPVLAAAAGKIERLFSSAAGGNTIYIRSPDRRTIHYYAHLAGYEPGLREGRQVRRGERLGTVGSTGNADPAAPHLHFAILRTTPDAQWWEPSTALNAYVLLTQRN